MSGPAREIYVFLDSVPELEFHTEFYGSIVELMMYGVYLSIYPYMLMICQCQMMSLPLSHWQVARPGRPGPGRALSFTR
jgi:hypothetical protein